MVNVLRGDWRRWRLVAFAIALLLIGFGISSCGQLSSQSSGSSHTRQSNPILEFVPRHSLLTAVVDTTMPLDKAWQRSGLARSVSQVTDSLFTPLAIDFNKDIRPWLGSHIAFAITDKDLDRDRRNGRQVGYLLVADIADGERLREFLELFWQRQVVAGFQPRFRTINGIPIIAGSVTQDAHQLAVAVLGGQTLLIANDVNVLRQSLRVSQTPTLQLSGYDCCAPAWINLRIPDVVDWLGLATPTEQRFMSKVQWHQLSATPVFNSQGLTINTQLTASGSDAALSDAPALDIVDLQDGPQQYLPMSMAWAAMGHDLRPLWSAIWHELDQYDSPPSFLQQWQRWRSMPLAEVLAKPLMQLLASDYAVGQLGDGSWLMAVTTTNPMEIKQLDDIAKQQGLTVSTLTLKGQPVIAWSRLKTRLDTRNRETTVETDLVALHTKVGDCDVFATSLDGIATALEAPSQRLLSNQRFQQTVRFMDKPNQGYIYGTWDEIERLLASNRWFSLVRPILLPWSQSIDAIAITSYGHTVNQSTGTVSILLKK